jgi:dihydroxyacetone kinase-like protein
MQRIVNDPDQVVEDMLRGFVAAYPDVVAPTDNPRVLRYRNAPISGKVGIVTGGGSGHKPAFIGYIGQNLVDAVAVGEVFTSPTAKSFLDAIHAADGGKGVAILYGNYAGDNMNVKLAMEDAEEDGIEVKRVIANDDVPSAPPQEREKRRGVAGEILMWKTAGARAATGGSLDEVIEVAQRTIDNTRSVGIGLAPCTIPAVGKPNFTVEDGKMEVGIGHHGEPGIKVDDLVSADRMAEMCLDVVLPDLPFASGDQVVVLVSGLGATPVMELYIFFARAAEVLADRGITVVHQYVGNYFTSLDMMGVTLSVLRLDDELRKLIVMDAYSMGLRQSGLGAS